MTFQIYCEISLYLKCVCNQCIENCLYAPTSYSLCVRARVHACVSQKKTQDAYENRMILQEEEKHKVFVLVFMLCSAALSSGFQKTKLKCLVQL